MKIVAIIPAHLASVRFPRKILTPIGSLPMIEHVRRRVLLSRCSEVYVATCDKEIADCVQSFILKDHRIRLLEYTKKNKVHLGN